MTGLYPAPGSTGRGEGQERRSRPVDCKQKVQAIIGGSLLSRPALDLNVYYVLALNEDETISWSILSATATAAADHGLPEEPARTGCSPDGERLFVSMPG